MSEPDTVGARLRQERTRLGYNVRDFADKAGVSKSTQSRYENGEAVPDSDYFNTVVRNEPGFELFWVIRGSEGDDAVREQRAALYPPEIREFIENYLLCPEVVKESLRTIAANAAGKRRQTTQEAKTRHGSIANKYRGAQIGGVIEGNFTGTAHIQVGGKGKK